MGTNFNQTEAFKENVSGDKRVGGQVIGELLKDGQFEKLSQHLNNLYASEQKSNPQFNQILAAAQQICLICQNMRAETERYRVAYTDAIRREQELQQHLTQLLNLVEQPVGLIDSNLPIQSEMPEDEEGNGRTWWQRLRTRLESKPSKVNVKEEKDEGGGTAVNPPMSPTSPTLTVYCMGTFRVYINENRIDNWNGNNAKAIFKYMVVNRNRPIPIEILMDLFWQTDEPDSARRNLYQAIYLLRQALQNPNHDYPYILSTNGCYGLNPDLTIWLDSEAFDRHYHNGHRFELSKENLKAVHEYEAADALYEGDFLSEDVYEEWPTLKRLEYQNAYLDILNRLSRYHYQQQNWAISIAYGQKLLQTDNCREDTHRRLMLAYCRQGQRHLALRQYQYCIEALLEELDANPAPETNELHQKIQQNHLQF
ncbi:MAG: hypothetical protein H6667_20685 [Ardenticatenaceae bacterium]|nr:hypothetical protein [Ardenticatenaceae bacterium]MCB9445695.1 hypothetical protein [Ardenticatenaceae bacterium]